MKKSSAYFVLISAILMVSIIGLASAQTSAFVQNINNVVGQVIELLNPVLKVIVGDYKAIGSFTSEDIFIVKLLLAILLFTLVYSVLSMSDVDFLQSVWVLWVISISVAILGVRFLPSASIVTILVPQATFGFVVSAIIPFILFAIFVERSISSQTARRVAWIFFGVVFLCFAAAMQDTAPDKIWIYYATAAISFVMMIFDGTIQKGLTRWTHEKVSDPARLNLIIEQRRIISQANKDLADHIITQQEHDKIVNNARKLMVKYST